MLAMPIFVWFYASLLGAGATVLLTLTVGLLWLKSRSLVKTYVCAMALGGLFLGTSLILARPPMSLAECLSWWILAGCIYLSATYLFFHFLNIPLTSVRLPILLKIARGEPIPTAAGRVSNAAELRIERLLASKQIVLDSDDRARLGPATPWMLRVCLCFDFLRRLLGIQNECR